MVDERSWIDVDGGHRIWIGDDGRVAAWEHPVRNGVGKHEISPVTPTTWMIVGAHPLSLTPSLYCEPSRGGCGLHGFVINGAWV